MLVVLRFGASSLCHDMLRSGIAWVLWRCCEVPTERAELIAGVDLCKQQAEQVEGLVAERQAEQRASVGGAVDFVVTVHIR